MTAHPSADYTDYAEMRGETPSADYADYVEIREEHPQVTQITLKLETSNRLPRYHVPELPQYHFPKLPQYDFPNLRGGQGRRGRHRLRRSTPIDFRGSEVYPPSLWRAIFSNFVCSFTDFGFEFFSVIFCHS